MIEQWGRRYGPVFRFSMGPRDVVGFTEPDAINAILRERPDGYRRWREVEAVARSSGSSARSPPRATTGGASAGSR